MTDLLERDDLLGSLAAYAAEAAGGSSRVVFVAGEAGVGKTALLDALRERVPDARWLTGACDGSFTPQPLGPLLDVAARLGGPLATACADGAPRDRLFRLLLDDLARATSLTVLLVEDVHWADEATLDLLRFLGRRLRDSRTLLVATYRHEGLPSDHPLRVTIGDLGAERSLRRLTVPPLSRAAVDALAARTGVAGGALYDLTGGNPFYVTEVLRAPDAGLPVSARDAVLARAARLSPEARALLDALAVLGTRAAPDLVAEVAGDVAALDECVAAGILAGDADGVRYRHELARLAVEDALPAHRRTALHARILGALGRRGADDAQLAHHADGARDRDAVLRYAPAAARRAAELKSHLEAAVQYERALRFAGHLPARERAALYDALGTEHALTDHWREATEARESALALWREAGDPLRVGDTLRLLARALHRMCRGADAVAATAAALETLEALPPSRELAWAYALAAGEQMYDDPAASVALCRRARAVVDELGLDDAALRSDTLNTEGCAELNLGRDPFPLLRLAQSTAAAAGADEQVGRAYANLSSLLAVAWRLPEAEACCVEGIAFCEDHDLSTYGNCVRGVHCEVLDRLGRWDDAERAALEELARPHLSPLNRYAPLSTLATVRARRGEAAGTLLDEALELATASGRAEIVAQVRLARVEVAWLAGDAAGAAAEAAAAREAALGASVDVEGPVAAWVRRAGADDAGLRAEPPYARSTPWRDAARAWREAGAPYFEALALYDSGESDGLRDALAIFDRLGATAAAALARAELRRRGVKAIPRGPRVATRADAFGLTPRQREVLSLLCGGLTNGEIAVRLYLSERTVDHHVSAVLGKLRVDSRRDAAKVAADAGVLALAEP